MEKLKISLSFLFAVMFSYMASAQNIIKGRIVNEQGKGIEYANIIVGNAYTMSNAEGYYELNLSTEKDTFMTISHISYETLHTSIYNHKIITMKSRQNQLPVVTVAGKKCKEKKIVRKGMKLPGDIMLDNYTSPIEEIGSVVSISKDYLVRNLEFEVKNSSYDFCRLRIIIYDINNQTFTPIMRKPLYVECKKNADDYTYHVKFDEKIVLQKGHNYYLGLCVVEGTEGCNITFPLYVHSSYARNLKNGKVRKLPVSIGMSLTGVEYSN